MRRTNQLLLLVGLSLVAAGCQQAQFQPREQICVTDTSTEQLLASAEDVLMRMHFVIDKADVQAGFITTRPLAGAQSFEFWRSDNVGSFNSSEADLHTIRRSVELNAESQDDKLCIRCSVRTERLSLPEHEIASNTMAYRMFTQSTQSIQRLYLHPKQKEEMAWLELGRDARLETEILNRLENKLQLAGRQ